MQSCRSEIDELGVVLEGAELEKPERSLGIDRVDDDANGLAGPPGVGDPDRETLVGEILGGPLRDTIASTETTSASRGSESGRLDVGRNHPSMASMPTCAAYPGC